ncbi:MAG: ATP-dependent helicase/nuclease subunit A, partial [Gammaproteobacteria bacterium]
MNEVIDLAQRQRAIEAGESFIVQAPAGSGKTELLIQRYLRVLSIVEAPEEIIAITFTRKAAAEMRARIINALDRAADEHATEDAAAEITHKLAQAVIERDRKLDWQLADNPTRLRIQTIDSLTASLTRQMPILARFGAQPETIENASEFYQLAAANTLAELNSGDAWSDSIAVLLGHLDNDLPRLRNMLASMLARRDQWLRHIAVQHQREELEAALTHLVESVLSQAAQSLSIVHQEELLALLRFAAKNLHDDESDSIITTCLDIERMPGSEAADLDKWRAITTLLFTQGDDWRKTANVKLGFPAASGNKVESETRKAMKTRFAALISNLSAEDEPAKLLKEIKYLPATQYTDSEWQVVDALYQLLILADAQLRVLFAERMQMDFSGITQAAIQALGTAEAPSDLAMQLDYQIKHILVDEFQDISINQYTLLEKLTAGWSSGDEHSLFLVGDPMQSIYRFREAEVGLFLNTWQERRLNQLALTPLNITVNFRSVPGIVTWINKAFTQILPRTADLARGAVNYVNADAFHPPGVDNPVHLHPIVGRDDEQEATLILKLINEIKQSEPQESIAILVRNRSHLTEIVKQLREAKLPYRAVDIEAMGQRAAIQDLLALTQAMTHFADRVAWLAILRAPWCGLTLADLHTLVADNKRLSVWECMQNSDRLQSLSADGRERLERMIAVLSKAFVEQGRRPLNRWIESIWMNIGGPASLQNESDLENSLSFFHLLEEFDEGGVLKEREVFAQQVAALYAVPAIGSESAVQIMTIHKAKG